ncbi:MAG: ComEA family DNA-binding protein [Chloroflexi bacterium]|nr:ComEA family DNA-binding protein [Chloroflexota bacterium]
MHGGSQAQRGWERLGQLALVLLFALALAGGIALMVRAGQPRGTEVIEPPPSAPAAMKVYLTGAVNEPGVVEVVQGSRVEDAVAAAGGLAQDADPLRVNLAALLRDGEHIHVARNGEPPGPEAVAPNAPKPINLNTATLGELDTLPGIGAAKAQTIMDYRQRHGPFRSVDDLLEVPGIGAATLERIRPLVTVE